MTQSSFDKQAHIANTFPAQIETERLLIRPPRPGDGPILYEAIQETFPELTRWMDWARRRPTLDESERHCRQTYQAFLTGIDFALFGFLKGSGAFVVGTGLHPRDWDVPKFEIGYWCRTSAQGHGYVTEAVRAITRVAFDVMGARRVEIRCDARNVRSRRVAELADYDLEGALHNDKIAADGILRDTLIFASTK